MMACRGPNRLPLRMAFIEAFGGGLDVEQFRVTRALVASAAALAPQIALR